MKYEFLDYVVIMGMAAAHVMAIGYSVASLFV
jgi:hypothetical protein